MPKFSHVLPVWALLLALAGCDPISRPVVLSPLIRLLAAGPSSSPAITEESLRPSKSSAAR